jgi:hypothetical protein
VKNLLLILVLMIFGIVPAAAGDCVEVGLEVEPELVPGEVYYFYAELTNCGDEAGIVYLDITVDYIWGAIEIPQVPVFMGAGVTFSHPLPFMLPPAIPSGSGSICVTATSGDAVSSDCVEFTIFNAGWGSSLNDADDFGKEEEPVAGHER